MKLFIVSKIIQNKIKAQYKRWLTLKNQINNKKTQRIAEKYLKMLMGCLRADPSVYSVGVPVLSPELYDEDKDSFDLVAPETDAA